MAMNFFNSFKIGDTFHNANGEDYTILAMDEKKNKAILFRTTEMNTPYYVGAHYMGLENWGHGHYFMENGLFAFKWFAEEKDEDEQKVVPFVSNIIDLLNEDGYDVWFYDKTVDDGQYKKYYWRTDIPSEFLGAKAFKIEMTTKNQFTNDSEFQLPVLIIEVKSEYDPGIRPFFDHGYTEGRYE